jgi:glucose-fructose oxidoreductase
VEAVLEFPGAVVGTMKTSFAEGFNFLDITCESGMIEMAPFSSYSGNKGISLLGEINFPYDVPWQQANQMDMDSLAIMANKPMPVPGEEGLRDIRIVEAILESAKTGNRVVI